MRSHLLVAVLSSYTIYVLFRKSSSIPTSSRLICTFSSIRFSVFCFMLRSLIQLELRFVQGLKYVCVLLPICILLHAGIQFEQHHLLKMLSLCQYVFLKYLSKLGVHRCVDYVWVFSLITLINISVFMPIPCCFCYYSFAIQLEIRNSETFRSYFVAQDCFSYPGFFSI